MNTGKARFSTLVAVLLLGVILSACNQIGTSIPTPRPSIDVGVGAQGEAEDTPEASWESYVSDSIAEQVLRQQAKVQFFERYQKPSITAQNLGGLVVDIDLVEDKTAFNITAGVRASANAEFDVRITFGNGDTDTRTCRVPANLEKDEESGLWYVINPEPLAVFLVCGV